MITLDTKKGKVEMTLTEFTRWACLMEAYHFINERAEELEVNPIDMLKPLAIEKYIDERYHAMLYDVRLEHEMGNI
jgi:hypothetical protein